MENREMTVTEQCLIEAKIESTEITMNSLCAVEFYDRPNDWKTLNIRIDQVPQLIIALENFLSYLMEKENIDITNNTGPCKTDLYSYVQDIRRPPKTPGQAIYKHCSACQGGYVHGVTPCYNESCIFFPFRPFDGTDYWLDKCLRTNN